MKLRGKTLDQKATKTIVFERPGEPVVFEAAAVLNTSDFDKICPPPTPPTIIKGDQRILNVEDARYKAALAERNVQYTSWLILQTLSATPELEWDKVKLDDPTTWHLWKDELTEAGLSDGEIAYILRTMMEVNALSEHRLDEARKSFLAGRAAADAASASPNTGNTIT